LPVYAHCVDGDSAWLDEKKPGFAWTMGEGNPDNKTDLTSKGEKISNESTEAALKAIEAHLASLSHGNTGDTQN